LSYTFWFALKLLVPKTQRLQTSGLRKWNLAILMVLTIQLLYGALMAGHKAATAAPTWPSINGDWIPGTLFRESPLSINFIDNVILIHFIHRGLAYLLLLLICIWSVQLYQAKGTLLFGKTKWLPLSIVFVQVILGIASVLSSTGIIPGHWGIFEWMAQIHQLTGMLLLLSLIWMYYLLGGSSTGS
jgi:heme a synthase